MSLLRFAARTLLASYFVINGAKAVRHPDDYAEAAQPVADKLLPPLKAALPSELAALLPHDAAGVARTTGVLQVVGGLSLATGIGRRAGASVLAVTMIPQLTSQNPVRSATAERVKLSADVAVLGGVVLAALDTEGEPDLGWRLRARRQLFASQAARKKAELAKNAGQATHEVTKGAARLRHRVEGALS